MAPRPLLSRCCESRPLSRLGSAIALMMPVVLLASSPSGSIAQTVCPDAGLSVVAEPNIASDICEMASRAVSDLSTCALQLDRPIQIVVVETLPEGCIAEYHCGQDRVALLSPLALNRELSDSHPLSQIDSAAHMYSILVHELAHAALESMPCPFSSCVASQEYIAHAMQMRSLPPAERATLLTRPDLARPIADEEINAIILQMAPNVFLQKAWQHFVQQDDPCGFVGRIASGDFLFDHEMR